MNTVYDNGDLMIGKVEIIKKFNDSLYKENAIEKEVWEELDNELKEIEPNTLIAIDYCNGMGLYIRKWEEKDIVYKEEN